MGTVSVGKVGPWRQAATVGWLGRAGAVFGLGWAVLLAGGLDRNRPSGIMVALDGNLQQKAQPGAPAKGRTRESNGTAVRGKTDTVVPLVMAIPPVGQAPAPAGKMVSAAGAPAAEESGRLRGGDARGKGAPTIRTVEIVSNPPGGRQHYGIGETIAIMVTFSEAVHVMGSPHVILRVGRDGKLATYESGAGTPELVFTYRVEEADDDGDGVSLGADSLRLGGGTVRDTSGKSSLLHLEGLEDNPWHKVDGVRPVLAADREAKVKGDSLMLTYTEALDGSSTPAVGDYQLTVQGERREVSEVVVGGRTVRLSLAREVEPGGAVTVSYNPWSEGAGRPIRDGAGNQAEGFTKRAVSNRTHGEGSPGDGALSRRAVQQIGELLEAKMRRTPAQRKVSSELLQAGDGTVTVDIRSEVTPEVLVRIRDLGGTVVNSVKRYGTVRAQLPAADVETVASLQGVRSIRTADQAVTHGETIGTPSDVVRRAPPAATTHWVDRTKGIFSHEVDSARQTHGVDGTGIGIGVIASGVDSLARRQSEGELPGRVTVLPGQAGKGTTGVTLLEIVHDLAPEAELYFATGNGGEAQLAANIEALCDAGADVIVGGTLNLRESAFQDNLVARAVNAAVADGCVYVSAAGDFGNLNDGSSAVWEGDFAAGTPLSVNGMQVGVRHDFGGGVEENRITRDSYYEFTLQWADPLGASANDYDLFLVNEDGEIIASSTDTQNGTQDPIEVIDSRGLYHTDARLVIVKVSGADRYLRLSANYGQLEIATAGSTFGHVATENAVTVAAVGIRQSGSYAPAYDGTESVRWHSAGGPRRIFYQADGTPITPGNFSSSGGKLLQKPDIAASDGVDVVYVYLFAATPRAAAHAGGIAALMLEAAGGPGNVTLASLRAAMTGAALDIEAEGVDRDSGAGIVMAPGAVAAVAVTTADRNKAPAASGSLADRTLAPDDSAVTIDVSSAFNDPDDDTLTYAALSSDPERVAVSMTGSSLTLTPVSPILATVTVRATDPGGLSAVQSFAVTVRVGTRDYDADDDGLIEVTTLAQLDGLRYDLDGNGQVDDPAEWQVYYTAFEQGALDMGCSQGCTGYELEADLNFDTDGSGDAGSGDTYWNGGDGWEPIGEGENGFTATFEGNGQVLSFLYIDRSGEDQVGLFGSVAGALRGLGLTGVDVTGQDFVGALVGDISGGSVRDSYATGRVEGRDAVGGLAGRSGTVSSSYATVSVSGTRGVGGLVGHQKAKLITASYATGSVTGTDAVGGLVGASDDQILAGYATGKVSGRGSRRSGSQVCGYEGGGVGGLVGNACSTIWASFATGVVSGTRAVGGLAGTGPSRFRSSYWDRETSGVQVGFGEDDANGNGVVDGAESPTAGVAGRASAVLQAPTGYSGIYRAWNLDLNGDNAPDDPWHFGTATQYPVLSADLNGDGQARWQEFGYQLRKGPMLSANSPAGQARVELSWTAVETSHWRPAPAVTYTLYRDDGSTVDAVAEDLDTLLHTDTGVSVGATYSYQAAAVVEGGEAARSTRVPVIVGAANQPPAAVGELEDKTLREGTAAVVIDVSGAFRDPEGDALDYEASSSSTGVAAVSVTGAEVTITPASAGRAVVTVTATDTAGSNTSAEQSFAVTVWTAAEVDYDADEDGLIEIRTLAQLDAVRHDLDGDGNPAVEGAAAYAAAFAEAVDGMGCDISDGCVGYELIADLDFDTNGSGRVDTGDTYWNDGEGWVPIGGAGSTGSTDRGVVTRRNPFHATFEGNGHTIAKLFVRTEHALVTGLFGYTGYDSEARSYSTIRHVGMIDVELAGYNYVGGLVGWNEGEILSSYATGQVSGWYSLGGLVGLNGGSILSSYATVRIRGYHQASGRVMGGLVGTNEKTSGGSNGGLPESRRGLIAGSYATGHLSGVNFTGGLVGNNDGTVAACYATGRVWSGSGGGLVGYNDDTITASYSTGQAFSLSSGDDALVHLNFGFIDYSYFDSRTSVWWSFNYSFREKTTEQLQTPTGYTGLYQNWNVDLDGDDQPDDPWHFGTTRQYPVLKADLDGDGRATWQEFGYQIREGPTLSGTTAVRDGKTQVDLTWTRVSTGHWNPAPPVTYTLTSPFGNIIAENLDGLRYTDTVTTSNCCGYQVAAVVSGGEATRSAPPYLELPDREGPSVSRFGFNLSGPEDTHPAGFVIEVFVIFAERVQVTGRPRVTLELGGGQRTAIFSSGGGYNALIFSYTVVAGDIDTDGMSIPAGRIDLNGGTIKDEAGNPAMLDYPRVEPKLSHRVDGNKPVLLGAAVDQALLTLTYGEALRSGSWVPDKDDFRVEVGGVERSISSLAVNGGVVELTLATAVGSGDAGITVSYSPGSNPIRDMAGNRADALSDRPVANTTGTSNTAPAFTGSADFTTVENRTERWRLTGIDADDGDEVTGWEISGGADRDRFSIDEVTGEFGFSQAPDYEMPTDLASPAGDNEYVVMVSVTGGAGSRALTTEQEIRVTVEDEDEPPGEPQAPFISERTLDSLKVEWTEPDNRSPAITSYVVRYRKVGGADSTEVQAGTAPAWTLTGLEEDTAYEVQVQARNDEGASPWSEPVKGRTEAPLTVEITTLEEPLVEGPFTVRVAFSRPVMDFDSNDIEIRVESDCRDSGNNPLYCIPSRGTLRYPDGAGAFSGPTFGLTLTPRTDEVAENYTLGIRIAAGSVLSSGGDKSNREGMLEVRVAPPGVTLSISSLDLAASPGSRSVRLSWNLPSDDGGSAIIRYEVRYAAVGEGLGPWRSVGEEARGVTVGGLVNGREYVFEVRAVNGLGKGAVETVGATPRRPPPGGGGGGGGLLFPPEAPAVLMAMPGDGTVRLEWSPPESDGGTPILRYEYRLKEGRGEFGEWTRIADSAPDEVNATGYTVGELGNGTVYVFELRGVNLVGNGRVSEAVEAVMGLDRAYWSNFGAEDLQGVEASLERGPFGGGPQSLRLRFGAGLRFEESELDGEGEGEVTETRSGSYGYRYTSRTTGELSLDYDGEESCELRLTFRGVGAGSYSYRCGGVLGGQGSFRLSGLNRAPEITSAGAFEVAENTARVGRVEAVDGDDEIGGYGIAGGADGGLFAVEAGELMFREAPDYEDPSDVESAEPASGAGDNEYIVVVEVSSGEGERERKGSRAIRVRVSDEEEPPGAPGAPVVTAEGTDSLQVSWREPENRGPAIVDYEVRYREGGEAGYSDGGHEGRGLEVRLLGLEEGTVYEVQVRAVNEEGISEWSEPGEGRTDMEEPDPEDPSDFTEGDLEGRRLRLRLEGEEGSAKSLELRFGEGNRFEQIESVGEEAGTRSEGVSRSGAYTYEKTGPHMGTVSLTYDDGASCEIRLSFTEAGAGTFSYDCGGGDPAEGSFHLTTGSLFVPVILSAAGQKQSFFTSELTLTNRGDGEVKLDYTYTAHRGGGSGTASEVLAAGMQKIETDALTYLRGLGIAIPETGNRIGTLRVEVRLGSEVEAVVRTTTLVPEGRAGLAYLGVAEEEGFEEAVYLCGLRQNNRDRSNVAFQNMGAPEEGAITVRTTVYSGEAADATARVLEDIELEPGGFHQYSGLLGVLGVPAQGYVRVERVEGTSPFYAYGVINDQANSDGSFIFPVAASSLEGTAGQTLPVIVETSEFRSELTVTNFSGEVRTLDFQFVAEGIETGDKAAAFSMTLEAGQQEIVAEVVDELRSQGVAGLGSTRGFYAGPLFVVAEGGDMSGIVIGARTGSEGGGGQYSVFYNAVPFGEAFSREAWVDGLQQNQENRSNLALINTGEVDGSPSVFHLEIYDGETGLLAETVVTKPVPARRWHQINGILLRSGPEIRQGYIRIEKVSGENPFLAYGVVNDGGAPGERSGDGAYLPARK